MYIKNVVIDTVIPCSMLQDESDRVGNNFRHTVQKDGFVLIEDLSTPVNDNGFLMNLWLETVLNKEYTELNKEYTEWD